MIAIAVALTAAACIAATLAFYGLATGVTLVVWLLYGAGLVTMVFAIRRRNTE